MQAGLVSGAGRGGSAQHGSRLIETVLASASLSWLKIYRYHTELCLESVLRLAFWSRHDSRVVDEDVQRLALLQEGLCGGSDGSETLHVHFEQSDLSALRLRLDFVDCLLA